MSKTRRTGVNHYKTPGAKYTLRRLREQKRNKQCNLCFWCQEEMNDIIYHPRKCTADHVIPLSEGGRTNHRNIVAACQECNEKRGRENERDRLEAVGLAISYIINPMVYYGSER